MKRLSLFLMAAALLLTGCMAAPQESAEAPAPRIAETTVPAETEQDPTLAMLAAYERVLEQFYTDHITPDGQELWLDEPNFGYIQENTFAIADVDSDGIEELILTFSTAPMAGMCTWVIGYDAQTDSIYVELSIFPAVDFYTGGLLEAGWSHNQGLAGDILWPYSVLHYRPEERSYQVTAHVDAWDKNLCDTASDGKPFPDEVDTDNIGAVYLITTETPDGLWETDTVSRAVYEAWHAAIRGDAKPIELEYLNTTLDNIHAVSPTE